MVLQAKYGNSHLQDPSLIGLTIDGRHKSEMLVPPFDVKAVWLAHMIRVEMVRAFTSGRSLIDCLAVSERLREEFQAPDRLSCIGVLFQGAGISGSHEGAVEGDVCVVSMEATLPLTPAFCRFGLSIPYDFQPGS